MSLTASPRFERCSFRTEGGHWALDVENEGVDWIMMPFLIRLFPWLDIAPPRFLALHNT